MRRIIPCLLLIPALSGCVASALINVATAPVKVASKAVDLATTSQSEADQTRGRNLRKLEELHLTNNQLTGLGFGIQTLGDDSLIANNSVSGFSGDALRALGQKSVVRNNTVTDCVRINANHADGFQSWIRWNGSSESGFCIRTCRTVSICLWTARRAPCVSINIRSH